MELNQDQKDALAALADIDLQWRNAKVDAAERAARLVAAEIEQIDRLRAQAVMRARELGVPKTQIAKRGLHTGSVNTVDTVLVRFLAEGSSTPPRIGPGRPLTIPATSPRSSVPISHLQTPTAGPAVTSGQNLTKLDAGGQMVRVTWHHFPSLNRAPGYPEVLSGVVQRDADARSGWRVMEDPTRQPSEFGDVPGFLDWEIDRNWFYDTEPRESHLPYHLNALVGLPEPGTGEE